MNKTALLLLALACAACAQTPANLGIFRRTAKPASFSAGISNPAPFIPTPWCMVPA